MCTVIYIPQINKKIFASLRDENPERHTISNPITYTAETTTYISPTDPKEGGTWLGINNKGNVIILLNGGFVKHERKSIYKKSRGLIVKELIENESPIFEWMLMDLSEIEPFSLVVYTESMLFQLVWDGTQKHKLRLNEHSCYIFSSSTLYTPIAKNNREKMFKNLIDNNETITENSLLNFFKSGYDPENGFLINRNNKVKTLCLSYIEINSQDFSFSYHDFINNTISHNYLSYELCAD